MIIFIRALIGLYSAGNCIWALYYIITGSPDDKILAGGYLLLGVICLFGCIYGCKRHDDASFNLVTFVFATFVLVVTLEKWTLQSYFPIKFVIWSGKFGHLGLSTDAIPLVITIIIIIPEIIELYNFRKEAKKYDYVVDRFK